MPGVDATVSPSTLSFGAAGETATYEVTFTTADAALGSWSTGSLTWKSAEHTVRSPLAVRPVAIAVPSWVEGMGTSGETPISGVSGVDGTITFDANGLAPFEELGSGAGAAGDPMTQYPLSIPAGELARYISLDAADNTADLDLYLLKVENGEAVQQWNGATGAADESILLENPEAGDYVVLVDLYAAGDEGEPIEFTVDTVGVGDGQQDGAFAADPASVTGSKGEPFSFAAEWRGLDLDAEYLGVMAYSDADERTYVHVTTGEVALPAPDRLAGGNRFETSVAVSQQGYPDGADVVYVASGLKFPDGLAAAPAAASDDAPLLLTRPDAVPSAVLEEIERLSPDRIVIVGGEPSVSAAVAAELEALTSEVVRLGGANRYETSRLVAQYAFDEGAGSAFLATGRNFPDALSAGAAAGKVDAPILLVDGRAGGADDATLAELDRLGAQNVYLQGDQNSMSNGIELDLDNAALTVHRFAGSDRFQTAVLVNQAFFTGPVPAMYIASGLKFPDALSASALAAAEGSPLYLTRPTCINSAIVTESLRLDQPPVVLLGDEATLSASVAAYEICG